MSNKKDSPLNQVKENLKRTTFHTETLDNNIVSFRFDALTREVLIPWVDMLQSNHSKWIDPIRLILDFRGAGAPSRYMIDRVPKALESLLMPPSTKIACLIDDNREAQFLHNAIEKWPTSIGKVEKFLNIDPALHWLIDD